METAVQLLELRERLKRFLRDGRIDEALDACDHAIAHTPNDTFAHTAKAQILQRKGEAIKAIQSYDTALAIDGDLHEARELLGGLLCRTFPVTAPPSSAPMADSPPFVYVLGSSYARSFSTGTLYLPLMLGTSFNLSFLTNELAARSAAHINAHLDRVDRRHPALFAFFESNALTHHQNGAGTQDLQRAGKLGPSDEVIVAGAHRYGGFLKTTVGRYPGLRLLALNACPQLVPEQQRYVELTNPILRRYCDELGVLYVDVWREFLDPATGFIREDVCTHPGNVHPSKAAISIVTEFLRARNVLPAEDNEFAWSHMMRFQIGPGAVTRLWTEPHAGAENLVNSRLVAFNSILERAIAHFIGSLPRDGRARVLVPHCREGMPLSRYRPTSRAVWSQRIPTPPR